MNDDREFDMMNDNDDDFEQEQNDQGDDQSNDNDDQDIDNKDDQDQDNKTTNDEDEDDWDGFGEDPNSDESSDDEDDDDDLTESERKLIDKRISRATKPVLSEMAELRLEKSVNDFLNDGDNRQIFKGLEQKIMQTAKHKNAQGWPIERVAYAVAGKRLMKLGAKMGREADDEASYTRHSGSPARNVSAKGGKPRSSAPDYEGMSDDQFDQELAKMGIHI